MKTEIIKISCDTPHLNHPSCFDSLPNMKQTSRLEYTWTKRGWLGGIVCKAANKKQLEILEARNTEHRIDAETA